MGIFKDIDAYTITLTGAQLEGRGKVSLLFFKIEKSVLILERKALCLPWVKFSIQNVVLRVSWRKTPKCFAAGPLFLVFLTKCLSKYWSTPVPQPPPPPLPWQIYGCEPAPKDYSFCKTLNLKCLAMFWIRLCLVNCSVICIVILS